MDIPEGFSRESFGGFDMIDEEVPDGSCREIALGLKHMFENLSREADEKNEELFLTPDLEHALRRLMIDPSDASLQHLCEASPSILNALDSFVEEQGKAPVIQIEQKTCSVFSQNVLINAAREIAFVLTVGRAQDDHAGRASYWRPDVHSALTEFLESPSSENAHTLLSVVPTFAPFFLEQASCMRVVDNEAD